MSDSTHTERRALELFRQLLEIDTSDRAGIDAELAEVEPELAVLVRRMLERLHSLTHRLERGWQQEWAEVDLPAELGPFTLVRELGRGGMGIVAEGQREAEGFTQRVAIKWIPAWQIDAARRQRFLFERDVVARLRHPHIARLVDGGEGSGGELWYAMELVHGKDLLSHCREHKLGVRPRVQLLLDLCDAVAHAHRHLILHRDIKPGNVLVDEEGQLKLIDFGIAKGLENEGDELTLDAAPMTPRFAAPEQLRGERPTTLSDLWQVAALGFELLSGQPARKDGALRKASDAVPEGAEHAASCGLDLKQLRRALRGDLDAILQKALRDEADQRYPSIEALAAELRAWIGGKPVAARRHERWYALGRFVSVHRWAVGFAAVAVTAVSVGGSVAMVQSTIAKDQTQAAEHVSDLLLRAMLSKSGTNLKTTTLPGYFDHVIETIADDTELEPERRYTLLSGIIQRSQDLGPTTASERGARELTALAREVFGEVSLEYAYAQDQLTSIELELHPESSEQMLARLDVTGAIYRRLGAENTMRYLEHLITRGALANHTGDFTLALDLAKDMHTLAQSIPDMPAEGRIAYMMPLATIYGNSGQYKEASAAADHLLEFAVNAAEESPGAGNTLDMLRAEACLMRALSDPASAVPMCTQTAHSMSEAGTLTSESGATVLRALGVAHGRRGEHAAALESLRKAERALVELYGEAEMPQLRSQVLRSIGFYAWRLGNKEESLAARERVFGWYTQRKQADTYHALDTRMDLAESLLDANRRDEARRLFDPGLDLAALPETDRKRWDDLAARANASAPH